MNQAYIQEGQSTPFDGGIVGPASVGDVGIVSGWCHSGASGLAMLLLRLPDDARTYVLGDWRAIRDICEELVGRKVVVDEVGGAFGEVMGITLAGDDMAQECAE